MSEPIVCNHGGLFDDFGTGCDVCWPVEYDEPSLELECQSCETMFMEGWKAGGLFFCSRECVEGDPVLSAEEVAAAVDTRSELELA